MAARLGERVEVAAADATDPEDVARALAGVDVAYYLIHALGTGARFEHARPAHRAAFAPAAREAGVGRIVYLGGLHPDGEELSPHLRVARARSARSCWPPACRPTVLQAAVILGSGSASFEMLRHLTERLPVMVDAALGRAPGSSRSRSATCCATSSAAAAMPADVSRAFDIGGPDVLTYREMMQRLRRAWPGLPRRLIVPVPVLTPRLSSHWVGLVTPVPGAARHAAGRVAASTRSCARSTTSPATCPTRRRG